MKNNKFIIVWIIFLLFLMICSIYNYLNPIKNSDEKKIFKGKIVNISMEYEYTEESEYLPKYILEVKNKNDELVSIFVDKETAQNYKNDQTINYYEEKGEYVITNEKENTENNNVIWLIIAIFEAVVIVILVIKVLKK